VFDEDYGLLERFIKTSDTGFKAASVGVIHDEKLAG
jgi:hypothetical protein